MTIDESHGWLVAVRLSMCKNAGSHHVVFLIIFFHLFPDSVPAASSTIHNGVRSTSQRHHRSLCHTSGCSFVALKEFRPSFLKHHHPHLWLFVLREYSSSLPWDVVVIHANELLVASVTKHNSVNALVVDLVGDKQLSDSLFFFCQHRKCAQEVAISEFSLVNIIRFNFVVEQSELALTCKGPQLSNSYPLSLTNLVLWSCSVQRFSVWREHRVRPFTRWLGVNESLELSNELGVSLAWLWGRRRWWRFHRSWLGTTLSKLVFQTLHLCCQLCHLFFSFFQISVCCEPEPFVFVFFTVTIIFTICDLLKVFLSSLFCTVVSTNTRTLAMYVSHSCVSFKISIKLNGLLLFICVYKQI